MSLDAMKQALEALEETESALARCMGPRKAEEGDRHRALAKSRTAITALRLAIEQAERQEPTPAMIQALTEQYDSDRAMGIGFNPQTLCRAVLAVQRQPLTDEQLKPIADEYRILFGGWVVDFARAIERKHGIGGWE